MRKIVFQLMKDLEHNIHQYNASLSEASKLRTAKFKENIINDIQEYFTKAHISLKDLEVEKIEEVQHIFKTLEFDKLDDLEEFLELKETGEKALETVKKRFQNLALANVFNYRVSYNGIIDHISQMTDFLKSTTQLYYAR